MGEKGRMDSGPISVFALIDMPPEHTEDFREWCRREHIVTKLAQPGFRSVRCIEALPPDVNPYSTGPAERLGPQFINIYEIDNLGALKTESNVRITTGGADQTDWSKRVHANFSRTLRNL